MFNPFKKRYTITEYKNQNGKSKFAATYSNLIQRIFINIDRMMIHIDNAGDLSGWPSSGEYSYFELANQAAQKHKAKVIEELKAEYKKSAIHYVE